MCRWAVCGGKGALVGRGEGGGDYRRLGEEWTVQDGVRERYEGPVTE